MDFSLSAFNERQKQAITKTDGPLLVISGAGTGKTHVLTGKVLYLLLEKNVPASEILCLTFTEKATAEMTTRIDASLPIGHPEIWIKTFHAWCDTVLRERGHEIGIPIDFKLLQDADLFQFLRQHIGEFQLDYYRSLGNPEKFIRPLQEYFSRLKDEDVESEAYLEFCKERSSKAKDAAEKEYVKKHLELAKAYEMYDRLLTQNSYLDFGGLIFYTLRLFEKRPSVLAEYQKRFHYILVDEFQDTNFAQNKLVSLLAASHKNLTVVGDDDQSIYKWRGASTENIQYFEKLFPKTKPLVLNENYRSPQTILDLAYAIIQKNNPNRLEVRQSLDKKLKARPNARPNLPTIHHFQDFRDEIDFVVEKASRALRDGNDTAILVRTNSLGLPFLEKLQHEKLPYQHFSAGTLFTKSGVKDCVALLRVLGNPWDDMALFRLLTNPVWKIPMETLLKLVQISKATARPLFDVLAGKQLVDIKKILASLIEFSREQSVSKVLSQFFEQSGYLKSVSPDNTEIPEDIARFSEKVKQFESTHRDKKVADFLAFAELLDEFGESRNTGENLDRDSIKILTIHGAKGLEFDAVFIPGLVSGKFPTFSRRDPFEIPEELVQEKLPTEDHHMEEERRLFYVAVTRTKKSLTMTYSDLYEGKKQWKVSPFVLESLESGKAIASSAPQKTKLKRNQPELAFGQRQHKSLKLNLTRLSYSQLDTFQTCPLKYQFRYIQKIPAQMPAVVNFGLSLHNTLKDFYTFIQKNPARKKDDLRPLLKECFEKNWIAAGYPSRKIQEEQKRLGYETLERFYLHERNNPATPKYLEKSFAFEIDGMTVTGRMDRIDELPDGTYEVIDYKSGSSSEKNLSKDLQLSIYALACRDVLKISVSRLSLYYLENLEKVSTTRSAEDLKSCRDEIAKWSDELRASDFSPTPGFHCRYCDFRLICPVAAPMVR